MTNWVLPGILKAEDVSSIAPELLTMLSNISTGIVLGYVNKFIDANLSSSDPVLAGAASTLSAAYEEVNRINGYLNSEEAKNLSDTLCALQYSDVSADMPMEKLVVYRLAILELLSEDEDFIRSYKNEIPDNRTHGLKTAYTAKLDDENLERTIKEMRTFVNDHPDQNFTGLKLIDRISDNKNLFQNSRAKLNTPTVLRKAIYKKDRLKSILRGLDFLLDKRESGEAPRAWRRV